MIIFVQDISLPSFQRSQRILLTENEKDAYVRCLARTYSGL